VKAPQTDRPKANYPQRKRGPKPDVDKMIATLRRYYLRLGGYREWGQGLGHHLYHHRLRLKPLTDQRRVQVFELRLDRAYKREHGRWRTFREIAETMGLCSSVVHRHWQHELRDFHAHTTRLIAMERGVQIHELLLELSTDPARNRRLCEEALRCGPRSDCERFRDAEGLRLIGEICSTGDQAECAVNSK
jgi:hypothetical protein